MIILLRANIFFIGLFFCTQICAQTFPIDVYGTDSRTAEKILKKVGPDLAQYIHSQSTGSIIEDENSELQHAQLKKKVMQTIHQEGDFAFVQISPIIYQDLKMYITIDLIEKKDHKRLGYIPDFNFKPTKKIIALKKDKQLNQLLQDWMTYEKIGFDLMLKGQAPVIKNRPPYHCIFGFDHPKLKRYQSIFEAESFRQKEKLITILKTDSDEERRKTAAFLLAHIKNGQEVINILTPFVNDPSSAVRNNVMRVLGETIWIVNPAHFDIDPIIKALDFPTETDRNKALCIISFLANQPKHARYIAQHAGVPLMASLKMTQPNLHDNAYNILRQISKKSYDERDYASWEAWFAQQASNGKNPI